MRQSIESRSIYLKLCPRCNGDVGIGSDQFGKYAYCLQCGFMTDLGRTKSMESLSRHGIREIVA